MPLRRCSRRLRRTRKDYSRKDRKSTRLNSSHSQISYAVFCFINKLAAGSPFFKTLPLEQHGLEFIYPPIAAAHPFDDGRAAALYKQVEQTAQALGDDEQSYIR